MCLQARRPVFSVTFRLEGPLRIVCFDYVGMKPEASDASCVLRPELLAPLATVLSFHCHPVLSRYLKAW